MKTYPQHPELLNSGNRIPDAPHREGYDAVPATLVDLALISRDPYMVAMAYLSTNGAEIASWLGDQTAALGAALADTRDALLSAFRLRGRRRMAEETLGMELPLRDDELDAMMAEVERFQWIEAERAGRDIWQEKDASNPARAALVEWFRRHFGSWYLSQRRPSRSFWSGGVL